MWWFIYAAAIVSLLWSFRGGQSAVWGAATLGAVVGLIVALLSGFNWSTIINGAAVGAICGVAANGLGAVSDRLRR